MSDKQAPVGVGSIAATNTGKKDVAGSIKMSEHADFNFSLLVLWMVACFSVVITLFFWWVQRDEEAALQEKLSAQNTVTQQVNLPSNLEVEKKAIAFKNSVSQLSAAYKSRFGMTAFLPEINKKINKNVQLSSLNVSSDGTVAINGTTNSYKSVAEQVMSLQASDKLTDVQLVSAAIVDKDGSQELNFSISAKPAIAGSGASSTSTTPSPLSILKQTQGGS